MANQATIDPLEVPFPCLSCDETFSSKTNLRKHVDSRHRVKNVCNGKGKLCLISHRKVEGNLLHVCDQCEYQHPDRASFKTHIKSQHVVL